MDKKLLVTNVNFEMWLEIETVLRNKIIWNELPTGTVRDNAHSKVVIGVVLIKRVVLIYDISKCSAIASRVNLHFTWLQF